VPSALVHGRQSTQSHNAKTETDKAALLAIIGFNRKEITSFQ
jgi:hypothetical protein